MATTRKRTKSTVSEHLDISVQGKLIDMEALGYCPYRADVIIPRSACSELKRLAMTLDANEATLSDGTLVKNSIPKTIAWMIERFAAQVRES